MRHSLRLRALPDSSSPYRMLRLLQALSLVVLLSVLEAGCGKKHVAAPVVPLPSPAPVETTTPTPAPAPAPAPATPAPSTNVQPQPQSPPPQDESNQKNRPAQVPPPQPQPAPQPPQNPPPQRRSSRPGEANGPSNQAPRLGDILTPEQQRQYNAAIDQNLSRAQSSLGSIANRQLTKEQQAVVAQIQSFIQQAQTTRKSNLPAARSLAERADVLARDLAGSLR